MASTETGSVGSEGERLVAADPGEGLVLEPVGERAGVRARPEGVGFSGEEFPERGGAAGDRGRRVAVRRAGRGRCWGRHRVEAAGGSGGTRRRGTPERWTRPTCRDRHPRHAGVHASHVRRDRRGVAAIARAPAPRVVTRRNLTSEQIRASASSSAAPRAAAVTCPRRRRPPRLRGAPALRALAPARDPELPFRRPRARRSHIASRPPVRASRGRPPLPRSRRVSTASFRIVPIVQRRCRRPCRAWRRAS